MFSLDDTIPENFNDEIGNVLKKITQIKTNTKKRQELVSDVVNIGKKQVLCRQLEVFHNHLNLLENILQKLRL